jgi:hypothetical protein
MARVITVNASMHNVEARGRRVHVPEGDYLLEQTDLRACSEEQFEKLDKSPFMIVVAKIVDGPDPAYNGRTYSEFLNFGDNEGQSFLGRYLHANGIGLPPEGTAIDYKFFTGMAQMVGQRVKGRKIGALITDNSYGGEVRSQVSEWYQEAEYATRKAPVTAQPSAGGNGAAAPQPLQLPNAQVTPPTAEPASPAPAPETADPQAAFQAELMGMLNPQPTT